MPVKPELELTDGFVLTAEYGSQRDNPEMADLKRQLVMHAWDDCGPEMGAGIISQDVPGATANDYVMRLLNDMEPVFNPQGWGARNIDAFRREKWYFGGRLTQYVEAHAAYATYRTGRMAVVRKYDGTWEEIIAAVTALKRQVGFCTQVTGAGHFMRIVGVRYDQAKGLLGFYMHDPYGEADLRDNHRGEYVNADGAYVFYPIDWLRNGRCWGSKSGADGTLTYYYTREGVP